MDSYNDDNEILTDMTDLLIEESVVKRYGWLYGSLFVVFFYYHSLYYIL